MKNYKKIILPVCFFISFFSFLFFSVPQVKAGAWGEDITAASLEFTLNKMYDQIQGSLMASLEIAANQTIKNTIDNTISQGLNGQAMFVTNWESFLFGQPLGTANLAMNDFYTLTTGGRYSMANYTVPNLSMSREGILNYSSYLVQGARSAIAAGQQIPTRPTILEYTNDPSQMFASGNWRAWNEFYSVPTNTPWGYQIAAQDYYNSVFSRQQIINSTMGQAYSGYMPQIKNGFVVTPGSTVAAIQANVEDLGNKIIAGATHPVQIISALVTRLAVKTLQTGIGAAQRVVEREYNNTVSGYTNQMRNALQGASPGAVFQPRY